MEGKGLDYVRPCDLGSWAGGSGRGEVDPVPHVHDLQLRSGFAEACAARDRLTLMRGFGTIIPRALSSQ